MDGQDSVDSSGIDGGARRAEDEQEAEDGDEEEEYVDAFESAVRYTVRYSFYVEHAALLIALVAAALLTYKSHNYRSHFNLNSPEVRVIVVSALAFAVSSILGSAVSLWKNHGRVTLRTIAMNAVMYAALAFGVHHLIAKEIAQWFYLVMAVSVFDTRSEWIARTVEKEADKTQ